MALFSRRPKVPLTDRQWLADGYNRFDRAQGPFLGSPERLVEGGDRALSGGDLAAALFFYARAIDKMQTHFMASSSSGRRYSAADLVVFDRYVSALQDVVDGHPDSDVASDDNNYNATYSVGMMRSIANGAESGGMDSNAYFQRVDRAMQLAAIET